MFTSIAEEGPQAMKDPAKLKRVSHHKHSIIYSSDVIELFVLIYDLILAGNLFWR